jgi:hypothetical protein
MKKWISWGENRCIRTQGLQDTAAALMMTTKSDTKSKAEIIDEE